MPAFAPGPTVWSLPVRLLHWLVAGGVLINLFNDTGYAHRMIGYGVLVLVCVRLMFGFLTRHSAERFRWPGVRETREHLRRLRQRLPDHHVGHNPLGQWAVYGMWLLIALLGLTGWLSRTDAFWGEDWPVDSHDWLANAMLAMVVLHVIAVVGMSWWLRLNLIKPMVIRTKS